MSLPSEVNSVSYTLSASAASLAVPFYFFLDTDLVVTRTRGTTTTTLTLDSDYTVTGAGVASGGTVAVTGQAVGDVILIARMVPLTQERTFTPLTKLSETNIEDALDKCVMGLQQLKRELDAKGYNGDTVWGGISGTLANQPDLVSALAEKANAADLGTAAGEDVNYFATAAQGAKADTALQAANNLSDVENAAMARGNIGAGTSSLALGETSSDAYRGDRGKVAYDYVSLLKALATAGYLKLAADGTPSIDARTLIGGTSAWGGTVAANLNTLTLTGPYTFYGTGAVSPATPATGAPFANSGHLWHSNSNVGTVSAAQMAISYDADPLLAWRTKVGSAWQAWSTPVKASEVGYLSGVTSAIQAQINGKAALAGSASQAFSTSTAASGSNTTLAASTAFVQAAIPVVSWYFKLSATGTGAGVATLQLTCTAPTTLTITGGGKFYTDSAGTAGETASRNLVVGLNTIYIKVTAGSSYCKVAQGEFISQINGWTSGTNAPSIKLKLSSLPSGVTIVSIYGSNTISGSLADLPSGVTYVSSGGSNTISGSLADLPSGITYVSIGGSNTISGSLADLPSGVTTVSISGSNTISGSLADLPSGVTLVSISGSNTISGSLADLPSGVTLVNISGSNTCTYNTASGSRTWASGMRAVYNRPATGVMTSAMIDALLIDLAAQPSWITEKAINIKGTRTSASDAAVTTLTGYGVAVTVN